MLKNRETETTLELKPSSSRARNAGQDQKVNENISVTEELTEFPHDNMILDIAIFNIARCSTNAKPHSFITIIHWNLKVCIHTCIILSEKYTTFRYFLQMYYFCNLIWYHFEIIARTLLNCSCCDKRTTTFFRHKICNTIYNLKVLLYTIMSYYWWLRNPTGNRLKL